MLVRGWRSLGDDAGLLCRWAQARLAGALAVNANFCVPGEWPSERALARAGKGNVQQGRSLAAVNLPREQWQVDAWARDLGQARELGGYRRSCRAARGSMRTGWGIFLIGLGLLPGLAFAGAAHATARAAVLGVAGALVALGAAAIKTAPREKADWIFLYDGGIAQVIEGDAASRVVPWSLLGHVLKEYSAGSEDTDPSLAAVHVAGVDGTVITAGKTYGAAVGQLERDVDEVTAAMRLPAAIERYDSGAPVLFGGLSVSQDEIAWAGGAERAAWRDIRSVRVRPYQIELNASRWKTGQVIGLEGVPDSCVAAQLIQEAAARRGVRQKGTPAAVAASAADRVTVAGTAVLSQAEVSEVLGWPAEAVTGPGTGGQAARFRGGGADLSLAIRKRHAADRAVARLFGRAVPGIGEQAWLLSRDRTLVVLAGPATAKLDLHGLPRSARADVLIPLARLAAARLTVPPGQ